MIKVSQSRSHYVAKIAKEKLDALFDDNRMHRMHPAERDANAPSTLQVTGLLSFASPALKFRSKSACDLVVRADLETKSCAR